MKELTLEILKEAYDDIERLTRLPWHRRMLALLKAKLGMKMTLEEWNSLNGSR